MLVFMTLSTHDSYSEVFFVWYDSRVQSTYLSDTGVCFVFKIEPHL
jgi:hypothetical protein